MTQLHEAPTRSIGWAWAWDNAYNAYQSLVLDNGESNGADKSDYIKYKGYYDQSYKPEFSWYDISYDGESAFDSFNPDLNVFVLLEDVDNYRNAGFSTATVYEMAHEVEKFKKNYKITLKVNGVEKTFYYGGEGYDDYSEFNEFAGLSSWDSTVSGIIGGWYSGNLDYTLEEGTFIVPGNNIVDRREEFADRPFIAPVIKHTSNWTTFSYYNALDFTNNIKACDDNGDEVFGGSIVSGQQL